MEPSSRRYGWLRLLALQILAWPLIGLVAGSIPEFVSIEPGTASHRQMYVYLQWGLLTPVVVQIAWMFPLFERRARNIVVHAVAAALLCLFRLNTDPYPQWTVESLQGTENIPSHILGTVMLSRDLFMYASVVLAVHLVLAVRRTLASERRASELRRRLEATEAELAIQSLPRDVIVRTLDEIARRARRDAGRADALIERFGDFLRAAIPSSQHGDRLSDPALLRALEDELESV